MQTLPGEILVKPRKMKQEMQAKFSAGVTRAELLNEYKGLTLPEKRVAACVASLKDETLCQLYSGRNNILISLMFVQALFAAFAGYTTGLSIGGQAPYWLAGIAASISFLFIIGFYRHSLTAYLAYIFLSISQLPNTFPSANDEPIELFIIWSITVGTILYVWHVKSKLYPYFGFFGAKKESGQFTFAR